MIFLAIFFALLIEQVRPLGAHSAPHQLARLWVAQVLRSCDAGSMGAARLAWALAVLLPAALALPCCETMAGLPTVVAFIGRSARCVAAARA